MLKPTSELVAVVSRSPVPALLLQVPSELILAASETASQIVGAEPSELVGHNFEDFTTDDPTGAIELVLTGRLKGFEAERVLRLRDGVRHVRVWVRVLEQPPPIEVVVAVLWRAGSLADSLPAPGPDQPRAIFGTISSELLIERISEDVSIFGLEASELVGAPLLRLMSVDSAADVLVALAEAALRETGGVCTSVLVPSVEGALPAELLVRRLIPSMSFAFSLVCAGDAANGSPDAEDVLRMLGSGLRALSTGEAASVLDRVGPAGAEKLTSRESEIVARLVSGDRVPAIAEALFLSQSTIRNHLSSAFGKLGVTSQQQLVDLYRAQA